MSTLHHKPLPQLFTVGSLVLAGLLFVGIIVLGTRQDTSSTLTDQNTHASTTHQTNRLRVQLWVYNPLTLAFDKPPEITNTPTPTPDTRQCPPTNNSTYKKFIRPYKVTDGNVQVELWGTNLKNGAAVEYYTKYFTKTHGVIDTSIKDDNGNGPTSIPDGIYNVCLKKIDNPAITKLCIAQNLYPEQRPAYTVWCSKVQFSANKWDNTVNIYLNEPHGGPAQ